MSSTRGPLAGAPGLSTSARNAVAALAAIAVGQAVAIVAMAEALAASISILATGSTGWQGWLWVLLTAVLLRAALSWAGDAVAVRAAAGTKAELRQAVLRHLLRGGEQQPTGGVAVLLTKGLDDLDRWFGQYLPALTSAAVLPALVGLRLLIADWLTALIVALTLPLVPLFMVLIGRFTQRRTEAALAALTRLGAHVAELARGLPVLIGLGRAQDAASALADTAESHRAKTMRTLRLAFGSALALELIATLSVAVVAVVVGVRLLDGGMDLRTGLLVLILAPECYLPLRAVGVAYHAAAGGVAAFRKVAELLAAPVPRPLPTPDSRDIVVRGLTVRWPDRTAATPAGLNLRVPKGGFVAVTGESGCGKSTLLAVLSGQIGVSDAEDAPSVRGTVSGVDIDRIGYVPQHPRCTEDTVLAEVALAGASLTDRVPDALVRRVLADVALRALALRDPAGLSAGELHRLALARALLRVRLGADVLLLDEPSAHLDLGTEAVVAGVLRSLRGSVSVLLVSHRDSMLDLADEVVGVAGCGIVRAPAARAPEPEYGERADRPAEPVAATGAPDPVRYRGLVASLARLLRPWSGRLCLAVLLATVALASGIALTATSAWLIVRAAQQPPMLTLMVAIVGVRAFGLARATLRYAERLVSHDAVLRMTGALRLRVWDSLAARGANGGTALGRLVSDVDSVGDLVLRGVLPVVVAVLTCGAVVTGMWLVLPGYGLLLAALTLLALLLVPGLAFWADHRSSAAQAEYRNRLLARVSAMLAAASDLRVHRAERRLGAEVAGLDRALRRTARRGAWASGLAGAVLVLLCGLASAGGLVLGARAIAGGELNPVLAGLLALVPLGLVEVVQPVITAAQQFPALAAVLARVRPQPRQPQAEPGAEPPSPIASLRLDGVSAAWPGQRAPVFAPVDASLRRGEWLAVTGPSGAGKSTLLATLLGFLRPSSGTYTLSGVDAARLPVQRLTERISWCPQDPMLFSSTLRGNLLLAAPASDAELRLALYRVGLGRFLATLPDGLDTKVGEAGAALSGGGRQRVAVARALLRRSEVVLLDEPTAHLDSAAATALMADLRHALAGKIVVLVTHDPAQARSCEHQLQLASRTFEQRESYVQTA